jgi:hypothetical protein
MGSSSEDFSSSETVLSKSIRSALERLGYWTMRINSGGRRGRMSLASAGTPDILILAPVYGWLEVKRPGDGRLLATQRRWHDKATRHGVRVAVVRSVSQALAKVREWREGA